MLYLQQHGRLQPPPDADMALGWLEQIRGFLVLAGPSSCRAGESESGRVGDGVLAYESNGLRTPMPGRFITWV